MIWCYNITILSIGEWIIEVIRYFQNKHNITSQILIIDDWLPSVQWPEFKRVQSLPKFLFYSVILSVTSYNVIAGIWYGLFGSAKRKKVIPRSVSVSQSFIILFYKWINKNTKKLYNMNSNNKRNEALTNDTV